MSFDDLVGALAVSEELPQPSMQVLSTNWDEYGPRCRALLRSYVRGEDLSEQTELALFFILHLFGEKADTASFADLCALAADAERFGSVLGDDAAVVSYPSLLISTYGDDPAPLHALIEAASGDALARGDALLVLAYLARSGRIPERSVYEYLAALPARLQPEQDNAVWLGYARAVAALGFSGLSRAVESMISRGLIGADLMTSADFWIALRDGQQEPHDLSNPVWDGFGPIGNAVEFLSAMYGDADTDLSEANYEAAEPIRNPLRDVGRNDPCPCGSGKKFKKCCLQAG